MFTATEYPRANLGGNNSGNDAFKALGHLALVWNQGSLNNAYISLEVPLSSAKTTMWTWSFLYRLSNVNVVVVHLRT